MDLRQAMRTIMEEHDLFYVEIDDQSLRKIYNLWVDDIFEDPVTELEFFYFGLYYCCIKSYDQMLKYYLPAIEMGNSEAMYALGRYYEDDEQYDQMKKYYLMAIEHENTAAMNSLAIYHERIDLDYPSMKKYYLMSIEKGNSTAMNNLALHYEQVEEDYKMAKKYYLMAIEEDDTIAMYNLAQYYEDVKQKYTKALYYYLLGEYDQEAASCLEKIKKQDIIPDDYFYNSVPLMSRRLSYFRLFIRVLQKELDRQEYADSPSS